MTEFSSLLEHVALDKHRLFITGDFNIHVDNSNDNNAKRLGNILDIFSLSQHVNSPTHTSGHILDLVITRKGDAPIAPPTPGPLISDHLGITCTLEITNLAHEKKVINFRKLKAIDMDDFKHDLNVALSNKQTSQDPDCLVEC